MDNYTLTIGQLLEKANAFDENKEIRFSYHHYISTDFGSHRADYSDMYISHFHKDQGIRMVKDFKDLLHQALDQKTMTGYKGGEFPITLDTLVWDASYGISGYAITDIVETDDEVLILTDKNV